MFPTIFTEFISFQINFKNSRNSKHLRKHYHFGPSKCFYEPKRLLKNSVDLSNTLKPLEHLAKYSSDPSDTSISPWRHSGNTRNIV
jgi:hypothetical protein